MVLVFFDFGEEIQDEEIDVLDFVVAELRRIARRSCSAGMCPLTRRPFLWASSMMAGTSAGLTEL